MGNHTTEKTIADKLYQCRESMINLLGPEKFKAKVEEYRPLIEKHKVDFECNDLEAVLAMAKILERSARSEAIIMLFAVGVEIMEPSL